LIVNTLDFMLSERRDEEAATAFFKQAINNNGFPALFLRKLVLGIPAQASGKNLTRPPMP
jgi:hypothetical protein